MAYLEKDDVSRDFLSGDPSAVIQILWLGFLAAAWVILAAHYNAYPSPFDGVVEVLRVVLIPALMVLGYGSVLIWLLGAGGRRDGKRSWMKVLAGFLTLMACLTVVA